MADRSSFQYWCISDADLQDLDPQKAREILVECFYEAQRETFARVKKQLGSRALEEDVRKSVVTAIKLAFKETGHSYEKPTRRALEDVVEMLANKAQSWGTPDDIIEHHKGEIQRLFAALAAYH
jgi:hypothetical protein